MHRHLITSLILSVTLLAGCQEEPPETVAENAPKPAEQESTAEEAAQQLQAPAAEDAEQKEQPPPKPPVLEDFQGEPQLSLFPRAGDYRPADDSERLPFWKTFIDHLVKVTGVAQEGSTGNRAWVFRGISTIDSLGYFSPIAVEPATEYRVSFYIAADLTEGASAGVGIIEFDRFLWIPHQYTKSTYKEHFRGIHKGVQLTGTIRGDHEFTFTTGPETGMVHLVLFREGPSDRNSLLFDNLKIEVAK